MRMRKKPNLGPRMERCAQFLDSGTGSSCAAVAQFEAGGGAALAGAGLRQGPLHGRDGGAEPKRALHRGGAGAGRHDRGHGALCRQGLTNVFFVDGDAARLREFFAPDEVDRLFINFCDPWPSNRHARRG